MNQSHNANMNNETNISIVLLEGERSSSPLMKMKLHNLKQHWIRNRTGNRVIREMFRSWDQLYCKDRPESMQFVLLPKPPQNSAARTIHVVSVSFRLLPWFTLLHNEYSWLLLGTLCPLVCTAETVSTVYPVYWHKRNTFIYSLSSKV